ILAVALLISLALCLTIGSYIGYNYSNTLQNHNVEQKLQRIDIFLQDVDHQQKSDMEIENGKELYEKEKYDQRKVEKKRQQHQRVKIKTQQPLLLQLFKRTASFIAAIKVCSTSELFH